VSLPDVRNAPAAPLHRLSRRQVLVAACGAALLTYGPAALAAGPVEVLRVAAHRAADGVYVDLETRFDLPGSVEEALQKGVALYFTAEADLRRPRWYWRDADVAHAVRTWRLNFQPLTQTYRVSFGGLSQAYTSLREALHAVQYCSQWRIAEPLAVDDDARYYVEVSYRLDTSQLPRPLQIGLGSQPEWNLTAERTILVGNGHSR
jgi:hypothetical protein